MPIRVIWFVPVAVLTALAAFLGLRFGQPLSETQIIHFYADKYVTEEGGLRTDCAAIPSLRDGTWIEVVCIGADMSGQNYLIGYQGQLLRRVTMRVPDA